MSMPRGQAGPSPAASLRRISLSYNNADSHASALRLILTLNPEWEKSEGKVDFIQFKDGITNTLLKAVKRRPGCTEEDLDKEAVLLRAYGRGTEVLIDREKETTSHALLSQCNLAPPLLARFHNGLLYRFIPGTVCTPADLTREPVWRGVARRLAEWHATLPVVFTDEPVMERDNELSLSVTGLKPCPSPEAINAITPGKGHPNIWTVMQKWIFALPDGTDAEKTRNAVLQKELSRMVKELGNEPGLGQDGLVFAHCDLLSGNVIIHPLHSKSATPSAKDEPYTVSFIDYEYATPAPAVFDVANHFAEWGGFECDYHALPSRSQRRAFLQEYLATYYHHLHNTSPSSTPTNPKPTQHSATPDLEAEITGLFHQVDLFRGIPGFYWGIWALIQATISQIDFDYAAYAEVRLGEYWAWRDEADGTRAREGKEMPLREIMWARDT